ncbi:MAG: thiamine phosphate synthase [Acidobacteriota bacterium]
MTPLRRDDLPAVYAIADVRALAPLPLPDAVEAMADAGIEWIQLRWKNPDDRRFLLWAEECLLRLEGHRTRLWIDDRADLACLLPVAGVHLGQNDLPAPAVRRLVGEGVWIGLSTHSESQARAAEADPAVDVVAVGPIFPTTGKANPDPVVGLEALRRIRALVEKPLVAIGGIDASNLDQVLAAGADSVAMLGAACRPPLAASAGRLRAAAERAFNPYPEVRP